MARKNFLAEKFSTRAIPGITFNVHFQCTFSSGWFKEYPHLEYSMKEDTALCFVCCLFPAGIGREKSSDAWIKGVKKWDKMKSLGKEKKGKLAQHFSSQAHKSALSNLGQFAHSMTQVDVMLKSN